MTVKFYFCGIKSKKIKQLWFYWNRQNYFSKAYFKSVLILIFKHFSRLI